MTKRTEVATGATVYQQKRNASAIGTLIPVRSGRARLPLSSSAFQDCCMPSPYAVAPLPPDFEVIEPTTLTMERSPDAAALVGVFERPDEMEPLSQLLMGLNCAPIAGLNGDGRLLPLPPQGLVAAIVSDRIAAPAGAVRVAVARLPDHPDRRACGLRAAARGSPRARRRGASAARGCQRARRMARAFRRQARSRPRPPCCWWTTIRCWPKSMRKPCAPRA